MNVAVPDHCLIMQRLHISRGSIQAYQQKTFDMKLALRAKSSHVQPQRYSHYATLSLYLVFSRRHRWNLVAIKVRFKVVCRPGQLIVKNTVTLNCSIMAARTRCWRNSRQKHSHAVLGQYACETISKISLNWTFFWNHSQVAMISRVANSMHTTLCHYNYSDNHDINSQ
jgi:hypothetical protein